MKKVVKYLILLIMLLSVPISFVFAHPGRTDSRGCHTCRTNCAKWGLSNGQYHCHNGGNSGDSSSSNSYRQTTTTTTKRIYGCTSKEAINYNASANVSDGTCLFERTQTKTEVINYETKIEGSLKSGKEKIITNGENGEKTITIKTITNESGEEVSSEIVSESITKEPIMQVIMYESLTTKNVNDSINNEQKSNAEESSNISFIVTILLLIINVIYGKKKPNVKLIINKITSINSGLKYLLYFLYFIFIIPVFVDIVLVVLDYIKKKK